MDAEALKTILNLQEENILLRRAISDAVVLLNRRRDHLVIEYGDKNVSHLFVEVRRVLEDIHKLQQPPTDRLQPEGESVNLSGLELL